ncbi:MAG TPA: sensor histidine kinase [Anaerolineales bacterium]|nr:sensor histidine kinase [Anaerolineales bacterium]
MDDQNGSTDALKNFENWEDARQVIQTELAVSREALSDLQRKISQSRIEVDKLSKRNAAMTVGLQKIRADTHSASKDEIRSTYDTAMDALQRLFVMRGQVEKMEIDAHARQRYVRLLEGVHRIMDMGMSNQPGSAGSFATVEMMIQAQETERQRLSRQMHDGPAQALANFILQAEIASRFFDVDAEKAREELGILKEAASETFQQVRDFIFNLRPMMLDDLGAIPTLRRYIEAMKEQTSTDIDILVTGADSRLESYLEVILFRSVQEMLAFALEQSQATEIHVQIDLSDHEVRVTVEDNGKGFDPKVFETEEYMGIKLIKDRSEMLGGYFEVDSAVGQGARIAFRIPVARLAESV